MPNHVRQNRAYRRRQKRLKLIFILLTVAAVAAIGAAAFLLPKTAGEETSGISSAFSSEDLSGDPSGEISTESSEKGSSVSSEPSSESSAETTTEPASEPSSETSSVGVSEISGPSLESSSSEAPSSAVSSAPSEPSYIEISGPSTGSDVSEPSSEVSEPSGDVPTEDFPDVPESTPVDDSYFDSAVFVGNSRTQGFVLYSGLTNVTAYTDRGLNVDSAATKQVVSLDGKKVTVLDALKLNSDCDSVYMMFGINELGWPREEIFIEKYTTLVDAIQNNHPDVQIYIQSILPVSKEKSDSDKYINNARIREFNSLIRQMAVDQGVYYLDLYTAMADENGNLPADAASDGVHLKKAYCVKWLEYLRTHVARAYVTEEEVNNEA